MNEVDAGASSETRRGFVARAPATYGDCRKRDSLQRRNAGSSVHTSSWAEPKWRTASITMPGFASPRALIRKKLYAMTPSRAGAHLSAIAGTGLLILALHSFMGRP